MPKNMTIRLDDDQADALEAVSAADGVSMAESIRTAIEEHIKAKRKDRAFQARLRASLERNQRILEKLASR